MSTKLQIENKKIASAKVLRLKKLQFKFLKMIHFNLMVIVLRMAE